MTEPSTLEQDLAFYYAAAEHRPALAALWTLDRRLADVVRAARDPTLGQLRLSWWHEALRALDTAPPTAEPVLTVLAQRVLPAGVGGAALARVVEGWEELLAPELTDAGLTAYAAGRGGGLFAAAATVLRSTDRIEPAGAGWALVDLAFHTTDLGLATRARALAAPLLDNALGARWSRAGRPLGALTHLARRDLAVPAGQPQPIGAPGRVARLAWHALTGR